MKALTVKNPWALMFFRCEAGQPTKDIENRSQKTNTRGRIAIHASLRFTLKEYRDACAFMNKIGVTPPSLEECRATAGKILGTVDLYGCIPPGNYSDMPHPKHLQWWIDDQWAWLVRDPKPLAKPLGGCTGRLGFWEWDGRA